MKIRRKKEWQESQKQETKTISQESNKESKQENRRK